MTIITAGNEQGKTGADDPMVIVEVDASAPTTITETPLEVEEVQVDQSKDSAKEDKEEKLGRSCCGCCCDMRRAVIIMNLISIVALVIGFFVDRFTIFDDAIDDINERQGDIVSKQEDKDEVNDTFRLLLILGCISIGTSLLAIYGALKFQHRMILLNTAFVPAEAALRLAFSFRLADSVDEFDYTWVNGGGVIIGAFFMTYVQISLIKEILQGIMAPETYRSREEQSCCCV